MNILFTQASQPYKLSDTTLEDYMSIILFDTWFFFFQSSSPADSIVYVTQKADQPVWLAGHDNHPGWGWLDQHLLQKQCEVEVG